MKNISIFFLCFFAACSSPNKIPDDVIGIDKMKLIVWDITRAGKLAEMQYSKDSVNRRLKTKELYQQVFNIYNVSKDDFYKSYKYYESHPDKNKILMDSLTAYAGRQRQELYKRYAE